MGGKRGEPTRYAGITKRTLKSGRTRYVAKATVIDRMGKRSYPEAAFDTLAEAHKWRTDTVRRSHARTYTPRSKMTVHQAIEAAITAEKAAKTENTAASFAAYLRPVDIVYGSILVGDLTRDDIHRLTAELLTGDVPGVVAWKPVTVNRMIRALRAVWRTLYRDGELDADPLALLDTIPTATTAEAAPRRGEVGGDDDDGGVPEDRFTDAEHAAILAAHDPAQIAPDGPGGNARRRWEGRMTRRVLIHLAFYGLRRGEIAGLRWEAVDIDSDNPRLTVRRLRVVGAVTGVHERGGVKTAAGRRTLPLTPAMVDVLRWQRERQATQREALGPLWRGEVEGGGHVYAHTDGRPVAPRTVGQHWRLVCTAAGVEYRRPHVARHTCGSVLHSAGVPIGTIAAWMGHADGGKLLLGTYNHTADSDLTAAAELFGRRGKEGKRRKKGKKKGASGSPETPSHLGGSGGI